MANLLTHSIIVLYAFVFICQCFKYNLIGWLWLSSMFWLVISVLGNMFLPGLSGLFKPTNLYLIPAYIFLAALFYGNKKKLNAQSSYLSNLIDSGQLQYLSLIIWMVLIYCLGQWMPNYSSIIFYLIKIILWQPIFWIGSQWILMWVLHQNQQATKRPLTSQELVLLTMLWQFFFVYLNLLGKV